MTTTTTTNSSSNSSSSLQHLLGANSFEVVINTYCMQVRDNDALVCFFGTFDQRSLVALQRQLLHAAFPLLESDRQAAHQSLALAHQKLFELGMDENHFDVLKEHFLDVLNDFCLSDETYECCNTGWDSIRYVFEENAKKYRPFVRAKMITNMTDDDILNGEDEQLSQSLRVESPPSSSVRPRRRRSSLGHLSTSRRRRPRSSSVPQRVLERHHDGTLSLMGSTTAAAAATAADDRRKKPIVRTRSGDKLLSMFRKSSKKQNTFEPQ